MFWVRCDVCMLSVFVCIGVKYIYAHQTMNTVDFDMPTCCTLCHASLHVPLMGMAEELFLLCVCGGVGCVGGTMAQTFHGFVPLLVLINAHCHLTI